MESLQEKPGHRGESCLGAERCSTQTFPALCSSSLKKMPRALQGLWYRQKRRCTPGTQNPVRWALEFLCGQEGWFHAAGCRGRAQGCRRGQQYQSLVGAAVAAVTTQGWFLEAEGLGAALPGHPMHWGSCRNASALSREQPRWETCAPRGDPSSCEALSLTGRRPGACQHLPHPCLGSGTKPLHSLSQFSWDSQKMRLKPLQTDCTRAEVAQSPLGHPHPLAPPRSRWRCQSCLHLPRSPLLNKPSGPARADLGQLSISPASVCSLLAPRRGGNSCFPYFECSLQSETMSSRLYT